MLLLSWSIGDARKWYAGRDLVPLFFRECKFRVGINHDEPRTFIVVTCGTAFITIGPIAHEMVCRPVDCTFVLFDRLYGTGCSVVVGAAVVSKLFFAHYCSEYDIVLLCVRIVGDVCTFASSIADDEGML